ncbi:MAG: primosomal protein N' [Rikenellaceae bacterium]
MHYIEIVVPLALPYDTLTYSTQQSVAVGQRVLVRVGSIARVVGFVRRVGVEPPQGIRIMPIREVLDGAPVVGEREFEFVEWVAKYYMCRVCDVVKLMWSPYLSTEFRSLRSTRKRKKVKEKLAANTLSIEIPKDKSTILLHTLSDIKLEELVQHYMSKKGYIVVLCATLREARETEAHLSNYFDTALYCSELPVKKRAKIALEVAMGTGARVIVGTKAALWLSYGELSGVVVLNEASFYHRQAVVPYISGRECAVMLCAMHSAQCLILSDMPSVESYYNAKYGEWGYIRTKPSMSHLRSIVLERGRDMIASYTKEAIASQMEQGKRVVVLQNRRGVASYMECSACHYIPQCPHCSVSLTLHSQYLGCHYCGHREPIPASCPKCGAPLENRGRGTQQIFEQIAELYPEANIVRLDADSFEQDAEFSKKLIAGDVEFDILIGTTLLLEAPIWDKLGVVALLNVDNMLVSSDFRVEEEAYRALSKIARECRERDAELIVQSARLDNRVVNAALNGTDEEFYREQIVERKALNYPPHSRLIMIEMRSVELATATRYMAAVERKLRPVFGDRLSAMYQPSVERQRGEHIVMMMLKIERSASSYRAKLRVQEALQTLPVIERLECRVYNG